jgi:hypothetical protein
MNLNGCQSRGQPSVMRLYFYRAKMYLGFAALLWFFLIPAAGAEIAGNVAEGIVNEALKGSRLPELNFSSDGLRVASRHFGSPPRIFETSMKDAGRLVPLPDNSVVHWMRWSRSNTDQLLIRYSRGRFDGLLSVSAVTFEIKELIPESYLLTRSAAGFRNQYELTFDKFFEPTQKQYWELTRDGELVPSNEGNDFFWVHQNSELKITIGSFSDFSILAGSFQTRFRATDQAKLSGAGLLSINRKGTPFALSEDETGKLILIQIDSMGAVQSVFGGINVDLDGVSLNPISGNPDIVYFESGGPMSLALAPSIATDLKKTEDMEFGWPFVIGRTSDDRKWLLEYSRHAGLPCYAVFHRDSNLRTPVGALRECQSKNIAGKLKTIRVKRDSEPDVEVIIGIPTTRSLCKSRGCPTALLLHGGPASRDKSNYDPLRTILLSRGLVTIQVNFRGSSGYGSSFQSLDAGQWSKGIVSDVLAGIEAAKKVIDIDSQQIVALGGSFGADLAFSLAIQGTTKCISVESATADLLGWLESKVAEQGEGSDLIYRLGDPRMDQDRRRIFKASALGNISRLLGVSISQFHGGVDKITPSAFNTEFRDAMLAGNPNYLYVEFNEEGHALSGVRLERLSLKDKFVGNCLGYFPAHVYIDAIARLNKVKSFRGGNLTRMYGEK